MSDSKIEIATQQVFSTRQPINLSDEFAQKVAEFALEETVQHVKEPRYSCLHDVVPIEFTEPLRDRPVEGLGGE